MARMKHIEDGHRPAHWRDGEGNVYFYRAGDGVSGDPYVYQWHDPANCYQELQRRLLDIQLLRVEMLVDNLGGGFRMTVRSREDYFRNSLRTTFERERPVRQVRVRFCTSYGHCPRSYASATADDILNVYSTTGDQMVVAKTIFSNHQSLIDFVNQVEEELVRQTLLMPADKVA